MHAPPGHCRTDKFALVFIQLFFKTFKQGERIRGATGKPGKHLIFVKTADLAGIALENGIALRDLTVAANYHDIPAAH
mgnify:CR=1 FL=1